MIDSNGKLLTHTINQLLLRWVCCYLVSRVNWWLHLLCQDAAHETKSSGSQVRQSFDRYKCIHCHDGNCTTVNRKKSTPPIQHHNCHASHPHAHHRRHSTSPATAESLLDNEIVERAEESLLILRYLLTRHKNQSDESRTINEWHLLALAVDKLLFWLFFVIIISSSLFFLVVVPAKKRGVSLIFSWSQAFLAPLVFFLSLSLLFSASRFSSSSLDSSAIVWKWYSHHI